MSLSLMGNSAETESRYSRIFPAYWAVESAPERILLTKGYNAPTLSVSREAYIKRTVNRNTAWNQ